ncbi:TetR/AcrR family transcriptional regulator [Amycolatopsis sp. cmx-11-12]|uniref:TetR/AcrR family transcriptional regulator n=1 Tax=Amycolatopsis sp. cmx-11-12 TaxID=2785795 RepID=UPI00391756D8
MTHADGAPARGKQRRGEELRRHILVTAKEVLLETGYEQTSMDTVEARAGTSKRSLYAHFENKDALFCGRFLHLMTWEPQVRTCRLNIAEAERLPGSSTAYFDAMFATTYARLAGYLTEHFDTDRADPLAQDLLSRTVLPRLIRTLLTADAVLKSPESPSEHTLADDVDLAAIREVVSAALPS